MFLPWLILGMLVPQEPLHSLPSEHASFAVLAHLQRGELDEAREEATLLLDDPDFPDAALLYVCSMLASRDAGPEPAAERMCALLEERLDNEVWDQPARRLRVVAASSSRSR